ncbi:MAG: outer membrane protein assembly factor BamA, partial [Saprospiraceae bacterium]|nr:outer membrane protein assembly factor BamA [Saprospiraceae bacterium]
MKVYIFGILLLFLGFYQANAQTPDTLLPTVPFEKPVEYEIGGIRVTGAEFSDAGALIAISGFKVGDKVRVPGGQFAKAVQSLWNLRLFTDVKILQERTIGDKIFLEIAVKELPRYTRHSYVGVKKNQHDDLNDIISKYLQKGAILTDNVKAALIYAMEQHYIDKGYQNVKVDIKQYPDEKSVNATR